MNVKYDTLPDYMQDAAREYVEQGIEPDHHDFLYELLCNDLIGTYKFGDDTNLAAIKDWLAWMFWEIPSPAWGSPEKVAAWCDKGGLKG